MTDRKVIHVVVPSMRGQYDSRFAVSLKNMELRFVTEQYKGLLEGKVPEWEMYSYDITDTFIVDARTKAVENALNGIDEHGYKAPPADYLIMIDDDMVMPQDAISRLLAHKKAAVAPLFHHRKPPYKAILMQYAKDPNEMKYITVEPNKRLQKVDAVGFGMICLDVNKTFRKMTPPYFWMAPEYGEDVFCCHKIRTEANQKIYVDTTIDVGHIAPPHVINRQVADDFRKQMGDEGYGMTAADALLSELPDVSRKDGQKGA
jgi:hypothetical protein